MEQKRRLLPYLVLPWGGESILLRTERFAGDINSRHALLSPLYSVSSIFIDHFVSICMLHSSQGLLLGLGKDGGAMHTHTLSHSIRQRPIDPSILHHLSGCVISKPFRGIRIKVAELYERTHHASMGCSKVCLTLATPRCR